MKALILALIFAATCVFAQLPAPGWLNQIKLSGLSGTTAQRLALINRQTFSQGEAKNLKIADKTVVVKCLEIREQSVLVQIEGLTSLYELTITGVIIAVDKHPVTALNTQAVAGVESPAPVAPKTVTPLILGGTMQLCLPVSHGKFFSLNTIQILVGIFLGLALVVAIVSRTTRSQSRKVDSQNTDPNLKDKGDEGEARVADTIDKRPL